MKKKNKKNEKLKLTKIKIANLGNKRLNAIEGGVMIPTTVFEEASITCRNCPSGGGWQHNTCGTITCNC